MAKFLRKKKSRKSCTPPSISLAGVEAKSTCGARRNRGYLASVGDVHVLQIMVKLSNQSRRSRLPGWGTEGGQQRQLVGCMAADGPDSRFRWKLRGCGHLRRLVRRTFEHLCEHGDRRHLSLAQRARNSHVDGPTTVGTCLVPAGDPACKGSRL
jgi:hypothetical protein